MLTALQKVTLGAWILFVPYHFITQRWSATTNIRTDLVIIYLLLIVLTLAIGIQWLVKQYRLRRK